jgi:hypothetical protein
MPKKTKLTVVEPVVEAAPEVIEAVASPSEVLASALDAWIKAYYRDITKARALRAATDLRASL